MKRKEEHSRGEATHVLRSMWEHSNYRGPGKAMWPEEGGELKKGKEEAMVWLDEPEATVVAHIRAYSSLKVLR